MPYALGRMGPICPMGLLSIICLLVIPKKIPRRGIVCTTPWYSQYHTVVFAVPHRGIVSTTLWYSQYHAVVLTLIKSIVCLDFLKGGFLSRGDDVLALAFLL